MSSGQHPNTTNSSRIPPRGIPPLPERPRRSVARVDYAALDNSDHVARDHGQQAPGNTRRRSAAKAAAPRPDTDAEYEAGSSSGGDDGLSDVDSEFGELSEDGQLSEDGEAAGAAEGLVELADAAMQQDKHRKQPGHKARKEQYIDARVTKQEAQQAYDAAPLSYNDTTNSDYMRIKNIFEWWSQYEPTVFKRTGKHKRAVNRACPKRKTPYRPDLNGPDGAQLAARFLQWYVMEGHEGYKGRSGTEFKSNSTLKKVHAALQKMFQLRSLAAAANHTAGSNSSAGKVVLLQADAIYKNTYDKCAALYKIQPNKPLPPGVDPQDNSEQSTFTYDELVKIAHHLLASDDPKDARDLSMLLWMSFTCGRGDDARPRRVCELTEPKLRSSIGPSKAWVVGLVQLMGKTVGDGFAAKGAIRHKEPLLCAQGALGRWLITRFTIEQEEFPHPCSEAWKETVLWPARDATKPMSYQNHMSRLTSLYQKLEILIGKVTHACRIFAARFGEEAGLSDAEIARLGFWALSEMQLCYLLTGLKASILLAMGGWDKDEPGMYWAERFMCTSPACLVDMLMPWLKDVRAAVEEADAAGKEVHYSVRGVLRLLPLLAYVVVQDALELCADGRPAEYKDNPVHKLLLTSDLFRAMLREYGAAKALGVFNASKPLTLSDKLDCVLRVISLVMQQQQSILSGQAVPAAGAAAIDMEAVLKQLHPSVQTEMKPLLMPEAAAVLEKLLQADKAAAAAGITGLHRQGTNPVPVMVVATEQEEEAQIHAELQQQEAEQRQQEEGLQQHKQQQPQAPSMPAAAAADTAAAADGLQPHTMAAGSAGDDGDDPLISLLVEEPSSHQGGSSTEQSQPEGAAAAAGALSPSTLFYTPTKGYRELSAISNRPVFSPTGTHAHPWWHGALGSRLPQQQQQVMQNEPWKQHGYPHGLPTSQLPGPGLMSMEQHQPLQPMVPLADLQVDAALESLHQQHQQQFELGAQQQQQQQSEIDRLRLENASLRQQLEQGPFAGAAAVAATPSMFSTADPTQALLQPTIAGVPGLFGQQPALQGGNAGLLAAVRYAAHQAGTAASYQVLRQVAQQGQTGQQAFSEQLQAGGSGAGGAATGGMGGAVVSSAAPGAAACEVPAKNPKAIKPWGQQASFAAFWAWYNTAPPGYTTSRAELERSKNSTWRQGVSKQRVSELNQMLRAISSKQDALKEQLGGIEATPDQAVAALDQEMKEGGLKNLAAYHKRYLKSPLLAIASAAAAAAADGDGGAAAAAAAEGVGAVVTDGVAAAADGSGANAAVGAASAVGGNGGAAAAAAGGPAQGKKKRPSDSSTAGRGGKKARS